ncbi:YitT family protein [Desemzia sp. C1]|uniref:YitT family protein n=1 Tax=Desemzia TaxID=82800 RepID=UPI001660F21A|nr:MULTISPECIES: YitT family protein [Desemzia]MCI3029631.1 YitT family protein [Desemzia sp. C1]
MQINKLHILKNLFLITFGCALFGFSLVNINIANDLAEGGFTGITLILNSLFGINPAYSTLILNIPMIFIGWKLLGNQSLIYTLYGTVMLSFFLDVWQRVPVTIPIGDDLLIAAILAGLGGGIGSGLIYRAGGTTGGSDIIARIAEKKYGIAMGKTLLAFDVLVLVLSLTYIDLPHMMYTLLNSFVFTRMVDFIQDGSYSGRGVLVISDKSGAIADNLLAELNRGVTYIKAEGAYSKEEKNILYCVMGAHEIVLAKNIINQTDPNAFISILSVHEVLGEGFSYDPKPKNRLLKAKK